MLTLHHSPLSRSMRVVWYCEEIDLAYRLEPVEMFSDAMQRPAYLKVNPLGKVPAIEDDGFLLWETAAILSYLDAKYGAGALIPPSDTEEGALTLQWMGYGENPLTVIMGEIASHSGRIPEDRRWPVLVDRGREIAPNLVGVIEGALDGREWILGDRFSAADIMLGFGLMIARHLEYVNADTPRTSAYLARLTARPAFERAAAV
ncbi:MAG: glutathione S-transferase family protein [Myxococcota bacterium]